MVDHRAEALQALSQYIDAQRSLLARTQSDLALLQSLRQDLAVSDDPHHVHENLSQLDVPLGEYQDDSILTQINWAAFRGHDTTSLSSFTQTLRDEWNASLQPATTQSSPLSELQQLVKDARTTILDPLMPQIQKLSSNYLQSLSMPSSSSSHNTSSGKRVRGAGLTVLPPKDAIIVIDDLPEDTQSASPPVIPPGSANQPHTPVSMNSRKRNPSARLKEAAESRPRRSAAQPKAPSMPVRNTGPKALDPETPHHEPPAKRSRYLSAPKSETYKQAWSESEQNLLERLLEQFPDGEKNRWQKISIAMNGRRTPRQVASRVQKYFQKLSQYGLLPGSTSKIAN